MKRGLFIAPFDELVDPRVMAGVASALERPSPMTKTTKGASPAA